MRAALPRGVPARVAAYRVLRRVHAEGARASPAVDAELRRGGLDPRDRAFAANLAFSTLRWEGTLDWALSRAVTRPLADVQDDLLDVLRMGAWQLLYGQVPDRAAVDTSVEVARREVADRTAGFVNGVLRGLTRMRATLPWPPADTDEGLGLATGYAGWIVRDARIRFGDRARAVLEAGNKAPGLTLRATGDPDALVEELRASGHAPDRGAHAPEAIRLPGVDPAGLTAVAEGRAAPQDEASMLVARALIAAGGADSLVLDACAGPGGKTTHLAQLGARVVAADVQGWRATLVAGLAERLGTADRVAVVTADATAPPWGPGRFSAVLVDAPCTGLGVVRRRPELRWNRDAGDAERLAELQRDILRASAPVVRPGGVLVYSVCTWTVAETAEVVQRFLAEQDDYTAEEPDTAGAGSQFPGDPGVQLAPDLQDTDGMYVACLRRRPAAF